jgi:hypothetical protein
MFNLYGFRFHWFVANGWGYALCGIAWTRTYHPLQTLPAGTELASCSETRMAY